MTQIPHAINGSLYLDPACPVTVPDLVDATRIILGFVQRQTYVAWRNERWWSDEQLHREIERDRGNWRFRQHEKYLTVVDTVFGLPICHEIVIASGIGEGQHVVKTLDLLNLAAVDSTDADIEFALTLLPRKALCRVLTQVHIPMTKVRKFDALLPENLLELMERAGLSPEEIINTASSAEIPDEATLTVMADLSAG